MAGAVAGGCEAGPGCPRQFARLRRIGSAYALAQPMECDAAKKGPSYRAIPCLNWTSLQSGSILAAYFPFGPCFTSKVTFCFS